MTPAQTQASIQNGAQSKGPANPEGKARSAQNSIKHGLCSKTFVLDDPTEAVRFEAVVDELIFTHQAATDLQKTACRHLAVAHWRRDVCDNLEMSFWQTVERGDICARDGGQGFPGIATINRYRARIARDMREARAELEEAKRLRAKAFEAEMKKAKELTERTQLKSLIQELGPEAFGLFRDTVAGDNMNKPEPPAMPVQERGTNEPKPVQGEPNRKAKRRAEKMARKVTRQRRK